MSQEWYKDYETKVKNFFYLSKKWSVTTSTKEIPYPIKMFEKLNLLPYDSNNKILIQDELNDFKTKLYDKLTSTSNNSEIILMDLENSFIPFIIEYKEWYRTNESLLKKFEPYSPYKFMHGEIIDLEKELLKYLNKYNMVFNDFSDFTDHYKQYSNIITIDNTGNALSKYKNIKSQSQNMETPTEYEKIKEKVESGLHHFKEKINVYFSERQYCNNTQLKYDKEFHRLLNFYFKYKELYNQIDTPTKINDDKKQYEWWFQVGLLFATGEINKLMDEYDQNATKLAKGYFQNENATRPWISSTYNNNDNNKNLYNYQNFDKIKKLMNHCEQEDIITCEKFKSHCDKIKYDLE
ncbi:hypothetical protein UJ101_01010 [Flavobacteriaceae bacterium UJ101]|nr:hypothetical protein UJ101_01010 [Flavobacteriaceae bacterium UJ101]